MSGSLGIVQVFLDSGESLRLIALEDVVACVLVHQHLIHDPTAFIKVLGILNFAAIIQREMVAYLGTGCIALAIGSHGVVLLGLYNVVQGEE